MSKVTAQLARERMDLARADVARGLLAWAEVAAAIGNAAGKGLGQVVIEPPAGVIIKGTTTAAELAAKLGAAGFRVTWRERRDAGDTLNHALVVSWEGAALAG